MTQLMIANTSKTDAYQYRAGTQLRILPAEADDCDAVVALFGALHHYNASLDAHFALAADWEKVLRQQFKMTVRQPDKLWLLVKEGNQAVGLVIAGIHTDSPLFQARRWVEVQALYVAPSHRRHGIARRLLKRVYAWAERQGLARIELFVTASNTRAQAVYADEGFTVSQAIMRKQLS